MPSFWKGKTRAEEKAERHAHEVAVKASVRLVVLERDWCTCRVCGKRLTIQTAEMHEMEARSKTRGREPEERFNTRVCITLCHDCHEKVTHHRIWLHAADPALGADGEVTSTRDRGGFVLAMALIVGWLESKL